MEYYFRNVDAAKCVSNVRCANECARTCLYLFHSHSEKNKILNNPFNPAEEIVDNGGKHSFFKCLN